MADAGSTKEREGFEQVYSIASAIGSQQREVLRASVVPFLGVICIVAPAVLHRFMLLCSTPCKC